MPPAARRGEVGQDTTEVKDLGGLGSQVEDLLAGLEARELEGKWGIGVFAPLWNKGFVEIANQNMVSFSTGGHGKFYSEELQLPEETPWMTPEEVSKKLEISVVEAVTLLGWLKELDWLSFLYDRAGLDWLRNSLNVHQGDVQQVVAHEFLPIWEGLWEAPLEVKAFKEAFSSKEARRATWLSESSVFPRAARASREWLQSLEEEYWSLIGASIIEVPTVDWGLDEMVDDDSEAPWEQEEASSEPQEVETVTDVGFSTWKRFEVPGSPEILWGSEDLLGDLGLLTESQETQNLVIPGIYSTGIDWEDLPERIQRAASIGEMFETLRGVRHGVSPLWYRLQKRYRKTGQIPYRGYVCRGEVQIRFANSSRGDESDKDFLTRAKETLNYILPMRTLNIEEDSDSIRVKLPEARKVDGVRPIADVGDLLTEEDLENLPRLFVGGFPIHGQLTGGAVLDKRMLPYLGTLVHHYVVRKRAFRVGRVSYGRFWENLKEVLAETETPGWARRLAYLIDSRLKKNLLPLWVEDSSTGGVNISFKALFEGDKGHYQALGLIPKLVHVFGLFEGTVVVKEDISEDRNCISIEQSQAQEATEASQPAAKKGPNTSWALEKLINLIAQSCVGGGSFSLKKGIGGTYLALFNEPKWDTSTLEEKLLAFEKWALEFKLKGYKQKEAGIFLLYPNNAS